MSERDLGTLNDYGADSIPTSVKQTQVFQATHMGGGSRLPFMNRSFISFTYGGKHIEDFNLIATISGDRLDRPGYSTFEDMVSVYDNLDGQHYWATHYRANQLDFTLSTDGIDQRTLDDFLYWFKPGTMRELILAEHPNRAIMARIATPPQLSLLPFESDVEFIISKTVHKTKTTLFKGDILLSLTMDKPHWYALKNILGIQNNGKYEDIWIDDNGQRWNIFASQDAMKILYEDGIPLGSMIDADMLLGNGTYAQSNSNDYRNRIFNLETNKGARIDPGDGSVGIIYGAILDISGNGISLLPQYSTDADLGYFFYSGTAPSPTIIKFTLTPERNESYFIKSPANSYASTNQNAYNTITIGSLHSQEMRFTTPNLLTSYNKALIVLQDKVKSGEAWETVRAAIRDTIRHTAVRNWAIKVIDFVQIKRDNSNEIITNDESALMCRLMSYLLQNIPENASQQPAFTSMSFVFNSETGEAIGTFSYRVPDRTIPERTEDWKSYGTLKENIVEDVGDMLRSNYIIIQDRNYPDIEQGSIVKWNATSITTRQYSHYIKHDVNGGLSQLQILYKNMYY